MPSTIRRTSTLRRALFAAYLAAALACLLAANANAADGPQYGSIGQYGEVTRFGGFDSTAYANEAYSGTLTPGEFLNPVGFEVDTQDATNGTAIYVLDRVSDWGDELTGSKPTEWRLQKLSDTGTVLGTTIFTLPNPPATTQASALGVNSPTGVLGLAIDDSTKTIYTLLYGTTGSGNAATPYAEEIIGWSTTPSGGQLVKPAGSASDTVSTPATVGGVTYTAPGVFSTASQIGALNLYNPQDLALDVTGGQTYLAVEADKNQRASNGAPSGPAIVEQISSTGAAGANWSPGAGPDIDAVAAGISTNPDGSLEVLLNPTIGSSLVDAVDLPADLASPTALADSAIDPGNADAAPLVVANTAGNHVSAGPQAVALSNGLYASDFYENTADAGYWEKGVNEGIRLISPTSGGLLAFPSTPTSSTIFDTLGNAASGDPCNISNTGAGGAAEGVSLAAGANGTVWALTSGQDSSGYSGSGSDAAFVSGRHVIELSPAAGSACAGPSGTFEYGAGSASEAASSPLTVSQGATVDFDASSVGYPAGAKPASVYAYEWDPTGSGTNTTVSDALGGPGAFQPAGTASYQYTTPGVYTPTLNVLGDFGDYQQTGTVIVQASSPPTAAFVTDSTAQVNEPVAFNASASQPASGASIADYEWNFGDGVTDETQSATDTHAYTSPGTYTVTLTVRDDDEQQSAPVSQQITVTSPSSGGGGTTTTTTTSGSAPPPAATIDRSATNVSPTAVEKNGEVVVTVSCPATKVSCAGTAEVKTASAVAAGTKKKAKKKVLALGSKAFSLSGGQRETLTIKLSAAGAALLKKSKRLKVSIVVSAHDSYGDPGSKTLGLTLAAPKTKTTKTTKTKKK